MKKKKITVKLNPAEYDYVVKISKENKVNFSEALRNIISSAIYEGRNVFKEKERFLLSKQLIYEINKIGNNINQIAKNNNSHYYTPNEKQKLFEMMNEIKRKLGD